jgi:hypothetical protein
MNEFEETGAIRMLAFLLRSELVLLPLVTANK